MSLNNVDMKWMIITWKRERKQELIKKVQGFSLSIVVLKFKFSKRHYWQFQFIPKRSHIWGVSFDPQSTNLIIIPLYNFVVIQLYSFAMRSHNNGLMTFYAAWEVWQIVYDILTTVRGVRRERGPLCIFN
jgi:hypothetical protein